MNQRVCIWATKNIFDGFVILHILELRIISTPESHQLRGAIEQSCLYLCVCVSEKCPVYLFLGAAPKCSKNVYQ